MKKLAVVTLAILWASPALAADCSWLKNVYQQKWIDVTAVAEAERSGSMSCIDFHKLQLRSMEPFFVAVAVVDGYTIFTTLPGNITGIDATIAVKGTGYAEHSGLPQGVYKFVGIGKFTKGNGFSENLVVIKPQ